MGKKKKDVLSLLEEMRFSDQNFDVDFDHTVLDLQEFDPFNEEVYDSDCEEYDDEE